MLPLGHAAFAYLWYVGIVVAVRRPLPVHWRLIPLAVGSQLPDLIDKPLSFVGILVSGRSLGHSVFTPVILVGLLVWAGSRGPDSDRNWGVISVRRAPLPFAVGYGFHLLGDSIEPLLAGRYDELRFLLWPVLPAIEYPKDAISPVERLLTVYAEPMAHPQLELVLVGAGVFVLLEARCRAVRGRDLP